MTGKDDKQEGVALYVKEKFKYVLFNEMDYRLNHDRKPVTQDQANNGNTMVGGYPPKQGEEVDKAFFNNCRKGPGQKSWSPLGYFNLPDICQQGSIVKKISI